MLCKLKDFCYYPQLQSVFRQIRNNKTSITVMSMKNQIKEGCPSTSNCPYRTSLHWLFTCLLMGPSAMVEIQHLFTNFMGETTYHFRVFVSAVSQFFPSMPRSFCYYLCKNYSDFTKQQLVFLDDVVNGNVKQAGLGSAHIIATFEAMKCVKDLQEEAAN